MSEIELEPGAGSVGRREVLKSGAASILAFATGALSPVARALSAAGEAVRPDSQRDAQIPRAFVYTELQLSVPLCLVPWRTMN